MDKLIKNIATAHGIKESEVIDVLTRMRMAGISATKAAKELGIVLNKIKNEKKKIS